MKWKASWLVAGVVGAGIGWLGHALAVRTMASSAPASSSQASPPSSAAPSSARVPPASASPSLDSSAPRAAAAPPAPCAEELARARAELQKYLPPNEQFARGAADPDAERRIAVDLGRVLKDVTHTLECRGRVCKVEIVEHRDARGDWMGAMQSDDVLRKLSRGFMFGATVPTKDPVSGEALVHSEAYITVADPAETNSLDFIGAAVKSFKAGGDVAACARRFPSAHGDLEVAVWLVEEQGFRVDSGGTLAMTDPGNCIESALEGALARVRLPERYQTAVVHTAFKLP